MEHSMKSLYEMMFSEKDNIMYETSIGYEIKKKTYGEVKEEIDGKTLCLADKLEKIPKGSVVGLYMENSLDWIEMLWCILKSGYNALLMNLRLDEETLEKTIKDCEVKAVITDKKQFSVLSVEASSVKAGQQGKDHGNDCFGTTIYVMSSGTTANVKVCGYTGEEFYYQVQDSYRIIKECDLMKKHYNGQLKQLTFLPFYHIFGLVAVYIWFGFFSRTFVELKNLEPQTITGTIKKHEITHIFAVPLFWEKVYEQAIKTIKGRGEKTYAKFLKGMEIVKKTSGFPALQKLLSKLMFKEVRANMFGESISFLISGGSEIKPEILEFFNGIGYHLANGYGMSELGITSVELDRGGNMLTEGYVGKPLNSVEYKLDEKGNLWVRGKTTASTVLENCEWRDVNRDEWFNTRDIAECEKGHYRMLGRRDDVIISSTGENLNPNIIEKQFSMDGVRGVCLIGPKTNGKCTPVLVVSTDKFVTPEIYVKVTKEVRERIVKGGLGAEIKDILYTTDELVVGDEFKLNRRRIREDYENGNITRILSEEKKKASDVDEKIKMAGKSPEGEKKESSDSAGKLQKESTGTVLTAGNVMAVRVREIVADALDVPKDRIGYDTDLFLELGGTSMDYFSVLCEIEEEFNVTIPDEIGTGLRTVQKICDYVEKNMGE